MFPKILLNLSFFNIYLLNLACWFKIACLLFWMWWFFWKYQFCSHWGKSKFCWLSLISGPRTQIRLHFKFGKHIFRKLKVQFDMTKPYPRSWVLSSKTWNLLHLKHLKLGDHVFTKASYEKLWFGMTKPSLLLWDIALWNLICL